MFGVKVLLRMAALCSALLAVMMTWSLESLSCGVTTAKVFITMFIITSVILTKEATKL